MLYGSCVQLLKSQLHRSFEKRCGASEATERFAKATMYVCSTRKMTRLSEKVMHQHISFLKEEKIRGYLAV